MTREGEITHEAIVAAIADTDKGRSRDGYYINALADHENGFKEGFIEGAKWADEHPHWISVDEELPEYEEPVLIVKERDGIWVVGTGTFYPYGEKGAWYSQGLEVNAKYWMPRPKLPKKGGKQ